MSVCYIVLLLLSHAPLWPILYSIWVYLLIIHDLHLYCYLKDQNRWILNPFKSSWMTDWLNLYAGRTQFKVPLRFSFELLSNHPECRSNWQLVVLIIKNRTSSILSVYKPEISSLHEPASPVEPIITSKVFENPLTALVYQVFSFGTSFFNRKFSCSQKIPAKYKTHKE